MRTKKTNGTHMMKRILTLGLCLLLAAGTACAETISDIGSYHSGWLSYLCTMPDGRILMGGGETDGTDSISSHAILVCLNTDRSICWKKTLDAGQAAAIVQERKRRVREAEEAEAKRREESARQREMTAKVEALTPTPVAAPSPVEEPTRSVTVMAQPECWKKMSFTIYFRNQEEYQKVLPELKALKEKMVQEGIQYGK